MAALGKLRLVGKVRRHSHHSRILVSQELIFGIAHETQLVQVDIARLLLLLLRRQRLLLLGMRLLLDRRWFRLLNLGGDLRLKNKQFVKNQ